MGQSGARAMGNETFYGDGLIIFYEQRFYGFTSNVFWF